LPLGTILLTGTSSLKSSPRPCWPWILSFLFIWLTSLSLKSFQVAFLGLFPIKEQNINKNPKLILVKWLKSS